MADERLDCGDSCCAFDGSGAGGMRTNGGCSCLEALGHRQARRVRRYIAGLTRERDEALVKLNTTEEEAQDLSEQVAEALAEVEIVTTALDSALCELPGASFGADRAKTLRYAKDVLDERAKLRARVAELEDGLRVMGCRLENGALWNDRADQAQTRISEARKLIAAAAYALDVEAVVSARVSDTEDPC